MARGKHPLFITPKLIRRSLADYYTGSGFPHPETDEGRLVYDVILSTRGWGPEAFKAATSDFLEAARFALFAEKVGPFLADAEEVLARPMPSDPKAKLALARGKKQAQAAVPVIKALLYPEDDEIV